VTVFGAVQIDTALHFVNRTKVRVHDSIGVSNGMDAPTFSGIVVCQSGGANQPLEQKERPSHCLRIGLAVRRLNECDYEMLQTCVVWQVEAIA
jgi:hypothetical protein